MFSKELENILESLPEYLSMASSAVFPLCPENTEKSKLETITKAIWFVVPFHFVAFLGLMPKDSGAGSVIFAALFVIVFLSWIGTILGVVTAKALGFSNAQRHNAISNWAAALMMAWLVTVSSLSLLVLALWCSSGGTEWIDIVSLLDSIFLDFPSLKGKGQIVVTTLFPLFGAAFLWFRFRGDPNASAGRRTLVALVAWVLCAVMLHFSIEFMSPVAVFA